MLVIGLVIALMVALGYIFYDKFRAAGQKIDSAITSSIEQRDNELITLALGKMTEAEYTALMHGNTAILTAKIDEEKRRRIPDYDFKVQQWEAAVQGIEAARQSHLNYFKRGTPYLATSSLEDVKVLQVAANQLRRELDEF